MDELIYFYPEGHTLHFSHGHPERPERVEVIRSALKDAGYWDDYPKLAPLSLSQTILEAIHSPHYLAYLQAACQRGQHLDLDTYTTYDSWDLALNAAGGAATAANAVWAGNARRGFALTRPPGHHASIDRGMGFCLLNNVALAAEFLIRENQSQRLAIIDLDVHHGNGSQDIFWRRAEVLYVSTHQYPLYPGTGRINERGAGIGYETNANIPFPPMSGDTAFRVSMESLILPLLDRYLPEMLLVSFGFDTHWLDPLANLQLSALTYQTLIAELADWADKHCQGRIVLVLEGGYDLKAGAACAQAVVSALLGQPWQDPIGPAPNPEDLSWEPVVEQARQVWGL